MSRNAGIAGNVVRTIVAEGETAKDEMIEKEGIIIATEAGKATEGRESRPTRPVHQQEEMEAGGIATNRISRQEDLPSPFLPSNLSPPRTATETNPAMVQSLPPSSSQISRPLVLSPPKQTLSKVSSSSTTNRRKLGNPSDCGDSTSSRARSKLVSLIVSDRRPRRILILILLQNCFMFIDSRRIYSDGTELYVVSSSCSATSQNASFVARILSDFVLFHSGRRHPHRSSVDFETTRRTSISTSYRAIPVRRDEKHDQVCPFLARYRDHELIQVL